jgi:Uma2 family endonuclease
MVHATKILYTVEEYFAHEETAEYKNEYYYGEIIPMTGGSINHNRIVRNLMTALDLEFTDRQCEAFPSDLRLQVKSGKNYTYPDVMAVCGEIQFFAGRDDTILNPAVIFEILSKSTDTTNKTTKFDDYKAIDSLQNYILVDQYKVYVECHVKQKNSTWKKIQYDKLEDKLKIPAVQAEVALSRIYQKVVFK